MLKVYKLNTEEEIENYKMLLSVLEIKNPYFLLDYIDIFCGGINNLICFSLTKSTNDTIIMLGYLQPILISDEKIKYFDFISPYGYTGPFFSPGIKDSDILDFWKRVDQWYLENNVVTEFIRFNLSENHIGYSGEIFPTMLNVKGRIVDEETQWVAFDHKVRKNVNKAKRDKNSSKVIYIDIEEDTIAEFYEIYIQTMKRTNANEKFFYPFEEFKRFINHNKEYAAICTIYFEGIPISSELLLVSKTSIYSFLGGTNENFFDKRPNDFLKVEALNWARSQGKQYYVLGGGYGYEDGIFKYKKSFFQIGRASCRERV